MELFIFCAVVLYALIPNLYYRNFCDKVIKKLPSKEKVLALTFDDGPDPRYTLKLLKVLKENNVKCTFFVLADKARKYPEIIKQIEEDGHYIGLHYLNHSNAIFKSPNKTEGDIFNCVKIMKKLGVKVKLFRPPWGIFNPVTFKCARKNDLKVVLWSIHAMDWSRWASVSFIEDRLVNEVKAGDIILLHDSRGAKNCPIKTIKALKSALPKLKEKGYKFVAIDEKIS